MLIIGRFLLEEPQVVKRRTQLPVLDPVDEVGHLAVHGCRDTETVAVAADGCSHFR